MEESLTVKVFYDDVLDLFTVECQGVFGFGKKEVRLEALGLEEVNKLTLGELVDLVCDDGETIDEDKWW